MTNLPRHLSAGHHRALMQSIDTPVNLKYLARFMTDFVSDPTEADDDRSDWLYAQGFLPEKLELYDFGTHDIELYLSDVQRWMTREINGDYTIVFNNKILFTQVFRNFCDIAPITAVWRNGRIIPYDTVWEDCLAGRLEEPRRFVAKPLGGGGGGNVYFIQVNRKSAVIESNDDNRKRFTLPVEKLNTLFDDARVPFMVTEFISQGAYSKTLYPLTVNTVRMLIVRDPETLLPHVVRTVQRIGTSDSYPIDNFSLGGLSAEIDIETGLVGPAVAAAGPHKGTRLEFHPDTGEQIAGLTVPNWSTIVEGMKDLFLQVPYIAYCGFDLILTEDGVVVLEGNSYSQVRLFQMHRPLLPDPTYVKVLKHYGIYRAS
ncbi:sugar-transfer associated ATP-grasp domain-containing protein [Limimaricola cinnabarinus]|uniref:sugar-transfer associated ATP-grasp domain-containing protein n=1 Tax=Limimaricola cinnabarinus TaxID=1125964 RepID=UPI00248F56BD|nr:sugar-transfer associated ATP-grasp domain-containing protein [Limimaricola cinnabarinus]